MTIVPPTEGVSTPPTNPSRSSDSEAPCGECGRPLPEFRLGDFIEVELSGEWKRGLIIAGGAADSTFSVAVVGYRGPLAYGNPEMIPGAEKFLRKVRVIPVVKGDA